MGKDSHQTNQKQKKKDKANKVIKKTKNLKEKSKRKIKPPARFKSALEEINGSFLPIRKKIDMIFQNKKKNEEGKNFMAQELEKLKKQLTAGLPKGINILYLFINQLKRVYQRKKKD